MGDELDSDRSRGIERFDGNALQLPGQQRLQLVDRPYPLVLISTLVGFVAGARFRKFVEGRTESLARLLRNRMPCRRGQSYCMASGPLTQAFGDSAASVTKWSRITRGRSSARWGHELQTVGEVILDLERTGIDKIRISNLSGHI